jgi:hypothetical protein
MNRRSVEDRVRACSQKHPDWTEKRIAKAIGSPIGLVRAVRGGGKPGLPASASDQPVGSFLLRGVHLLSKKPLDVMKGRFYALQKGVGYRIDSLAKSWECSEDTIRDHGKKHGALRYVEATPGEYVPVIVHPETKQGA